MSMYHLRRLGRGLAVLCFLGTGLSVNGQKEEIRVLRDDYEELRVEFSIGSLEVSEQQVEGRWFSHLSLAGYGAATEVGKPDVPTFSRLIEVPLCETFDVELTGARYDTVEAAAVGMRYALLPLQPSRCKSDSTKAVLVQDAATYERDAYYGVATTVEAVGVARDRRLARLQFSPVRYNPVSNQLIICREATVHVRYRKADEVATRALFDRYHSPAFASGCEALNSLYPKDVRSTAPVRYLIVAHSSFRGQLDDFVQWKRRKGFLTQIVYTDDAAVGGDTTSIRTYLQGQYSNATAAMPAPTYLLLVGDNEQIPAFTGVTDDDHITDLYYTTWTAGDHLPDCYYGRFSAQTVAQLMPQVQKTLMYEQYTFSDPSFLNRAVMVAGVDGGTAGDNGYSHADPAMDYAITHYVNGDHGYQTVYYYKNNTSIVPVATNVVMGSSASSNSATVRNRYNQGAGWVNYSAHGSPTSWGTPNFTTTHISQMTNQEKFGLWIGNCCQTNTFQQTTCFGEALLRKGDYCGAVGYIGGSNSTYWGEDFYWAVGVRNSINAYMSLSYNANNKGCYDLLWHTHGEAQSEWVSTQGQVMMSGNMAVESSTSGQKHYYWEIYHLMGDPSVMIYLQQANVATLQVPPQIAEDFAVLNVQTVPYAYVAMTDTLTHGLVSSAYADATGLAVLTLPAGLTVGGYEVAASAQQYRTAFAPLSVVPQTSAYTFVETLMPLQTMEAGTTVPLHLTLRNGNLTTRHIVVHLSTDGGNLTLSHDSLAIDSLAAGAVLPIDSLVSVAVDAQAADESQGVITATVQWDSATVPMVSRFPFLLAAPVIEMTYPATPSRMQPGGHATATLQVTNRGHAALPTSQIALLSPTPLLRVTGVTGDTAAFSLTPGATVTRNFTLHADNTDVGGITVPLNVSLASLGRQQNDTLAIHIGAPVVETFNSGTFSSTGWGGNALPWGFCDTVVHQGAYSMRSYGALNNKQNSELTLTYEVWRDDSISFYYKVSSEANYDKFHFYIDGADMMNASGQVGWTRAAFAVSRGTHTFTFSYEKDYSVSKYSDCAWIDDLTLPVAVRPTQFIDIEACAGDTVVMRGDTLDTRTAASGHFREQSGDTLVMATYHVYPVATAERRLEGCVNLVWQGQLYTESDTLVQHLTTRHGCDSTQTVYLIVNTSIVNWLYDTVVENQLPYSYMGSLYNNSVEHVRHSYRTASGCDSVVDFTLTVYWNCEVEVDTLVCNDMLPLEWYGHLFAEAGGMTDTLTTLHGADSVVHLTLSVGHPVADTIADSAVGSTYLWGDSLYTASGSYSQTFTTVAGCDSVVTLLLTLTDSAAGITPPPVNGSPLTVYPNPTRGVVNFSADVETLTVYDAVGRRVADYERVRRVDLTELPNGSYVLRVTAAGVSSECRILIKH